MRSCLRHVVRARCPEAGRFVILAAETAHYPVALDGLRRDVRQVAHGDLDLPALPAELAARAAHHETDDRQDGDHYQGEFPVHLQQIGKQEDDRESFPDHHLDCVGGGAGDHRHVVGDARDQVAGVLLVEITIRQPEQTVEELTPQIVDQGERNPGQIIAAEEGANPLPADDHDQQQGHGVDQGQGAEQRECDLSGAGRRVEAIDEVFQNGGHHRLR
jgi:hypothetical protein